VERLQQVAIRRDAFFEDMMAGRKFVEEDDRTLIGKTVDRAPLGHDAATSDAEYSPLLNSIEFPAGILQPPAFDMNAVDGRNYGAIGVVIGHEISHGFDDQGAQFDFLGRLRNWWTDADLKDFQARAACVADQFDHYYIEKDIHHNGKARARRKHWRSGRGQDRLSRLPEIARRQAAPRGHRRLHARAAVSSLPGDSSAATEIRPEAQRLMVQGDPHPIAKYRVIGPLSNLPEFQKAWSCKADAPMVRPEGKRCDVW